MSPISVILDFILHSRMCVLIQGSQGSYPERCRAWDGVNNEREDKAIRMWSQPVRDQGRGVGGDGLKMKKEGVELCGELNQKNMYIRSQHSLFKQKPYELVHTLQELHSLPIQPTEKTFCLQ